VKKEQNVCVWTGIVCGSPDRDTRDRNRNKNRDRHRNLQEDHYVVAKITMPWEFFPPKLLFSQRWHSSFSRRYSKWSTAIDLYNNQLTGEISEDFSKLKNLVGLYLSKNGLSGEIPSALGQMTKLEHLWLEETDLTGPIKNHLVICKI